MANKPITTWENERGISQQYNGQGSHACEHHNGSKQTQQNQQEESEEKGEQPGTVYQPAPGSSLTISELVPALQVLDDSDNKDANGDQSSQSQREQEQPTEPHGYYLRQETVVHNPYWPDVSDFCGQDGTWTSWHLSLLSKFDCSWKYFQSESSKITYARDHCKGAAFETIKYRADLHGPNPYSSVDDLLRDLELTFGETDQAYKSMADLTNPKFRMGLWTPNETLNQFIVRLNTAFGSLDFEDWVKKRYLMNHLTRDLCMHFIYLPRTMSYVEAVDHLRMVDFEVNRLDEIRPDEKPGVNRLDETRPDEKPGVNNRLDEIRSDEKPGGSKSPDSRRRRRGRRGRRRTPEPEIKTTTRDVSYTVHFESYPTELKEVLRNQARCCKCGETGHRARDIDAPCKDKRPLSVKAMTEKLKLNNSTDPDIGWTDPDHEVDSTL